MAKQALQLPCLDHAGNAHFKIEKWKNSDSESQHLFWPFVEETLNIGPKIDKAPLIALEDANRMYMYRENDGGEDAGAIV